MNNEYVDQQETQDYQKLIQFNKKLKLANLKPAPKGHYCDAFAMKNDNKVNIELKTRLQELIIVNNGYKIKGKLENGGEYVDDSLLIESHKIADLLLDYVILGIVPLYVNFLDNCTIVFNLSKLRHRPRKKHIRAFSKWKDSFEIQDRLCLSLKDAYIYNNKYELIYKNYE